jgi:hemerythrin-like domain-containing protein
MNRYTMKATGLLINEHKLVLRALYILEQMVDRIRRSHSVDQRDIEDVVEFLRLFGEHHQSKEEDVLFPALLRVGGECQQRNLKHIMFEHSQERSLLSSIAEAIHTDEKVDFAYYAERLIDILRGHIYKEDHILFSLADGILSPQEDERVASELFALDSRFSRDEWNRMLGRLNALEWQYLRKTVPALS